MAKFRVRNLLGKVPFLDGLRLSTLSSVCTYGIKFFEASYPTIKIYSPGASELLSQGKPVILAVYHGRMIGLLKAFKDRSKLSILISVSRDGEIITRALTALGFGPIPRGSQKQGAVKGGIQMVKAAQSGQSLAVLVDGPRGPIYEVKIGIIKMAQMTGLPIVPFATASQRTMTMWGWDKFMATHWGSPILHVYGDPIVVPDDTTDEALDELRVQLEEAMNLLRDSADQYWSALVSG